MRNPRDEYALWGLALLAATSIVCTAVALKDPILESWYLWRLDSEDVEKRQRAASGLGRMRSRRAVPKLIEILKRENVLGENRPEPEGPILHYSADALANIGVPAISALIETFEDEVNLSELGDPDDDYRLSAALSLERIGEPAVKPLVAAMKSDTSNTRLFSAVALGQLGARAQHALPVLQAALDDENELVRRAAAAAVRRIERRLTNGH